MSKKILYFLEIFIIILASIYYIFKEVIPDYRKNIGSSDKMINTSIYKNMIEIKINNKVNFAILINDESKIYHLLFFSENALCLYNKNIENTEIYDGLEKIVKLLIENNLLDNFSNIKIIKYNDFYYKNFLNNFKLIFNKFNLKSDFFEIESNIKEKLLDVDLIVKDEKDLENILINLDFYSKELIKSYKGKISTKYSMLKDEDVLSLSNNVYKKIEKYVIDNKIENLEKDNDELVISMIPIDSYLKYYPTTNSWFYVKDKNIYAYIELNLNEKNYKYCYNGSIDLVKEGVC